MPKSTFKMLQCLRRKFLKFARPFFNILHERLKPTAQKVFVFGVILVRIFLHSDRIWTGTP